MSEIEQAKHALLGSIKLAIAHVRGDSSYPAYIPEQEIDQLIAAVQRAGAAPAEQDRPWDWGDWKPCAEHPHAEHELVCFACNPALTADGAASEAHAPTATCDCGYENKINGQCSCGYVHGVPVSAGEKEQP